MFWLIAAGVLGKRLGLRGRPTDMLNFAYISSEFGSRFTSGTKRGRYSGGSQLFG